MNGTNESPGRAALVTGGSSGIGFALARLLVEEGAAVSIVGRNGDKLAAAAERLRAADGTVLEVKADLSDEEGPIAAVERHREEYGRLDVLVNNAGICLASKVGRQDPAAIDAVLHTDLRAVVLLFQESLDLLLAAAEEYGKADVLNLASLLGRHPAPWPAVYSHESGGDLVHPVDDPLVRPEGRAVERDLPRLRGHPDERRRQGPRRRRHDPRRGHRRTRPIDPAPLTPDLHPRGPHGPLA